MQHLLNTSNDVEQSNPGPAHLVLSTTIFLSALIKGYFEHLFWRLVFRQRSPLRLLRIIYYDKYPTYASPAFLIFPWLT